MNQYLEEIAKSVQLKFSNDRKIWLMRHLIWFSESLSKAQELIKF